MRKTRSNLSTEKITKINNAKIKKEKRLNENENQRIKRLQIRSEKSKLR